MMQTDKKPDKALYVPPALRSTSKISNPKRKSSKIFSVETDCDSERTQSLEALLQALSISGVSKSSKSSCDNNKPNSVLTGTNSADITKSTTAGREPKLDYSNFGHILELYNFRRELNSADLQSELSGFEDSGFYLKWVDDTHCLAVFSSQTEAMRALSQISGLMLDARQIKDASLESKIKLAKSPGDWAMPYKKRPPTSSSTAQRLILGHLSLRSTPTKSPEELEKEKRDKEALRDAREQYERRKKAQKDIWEDDKWDFV